MLLGQRGREEAELGELGDDAAVDRLGAVPLGRVRRDLGVAELPRRLPDQLLLVGEREVHAAILIRTKKIPPGAVSAFVHLTDQPIRACTLHTARWSFDLLARRTRREHQCMTRAHTPRKRVRQTKVRSFCEIRNRCRGRRLFRDDRGGRSGSSGPATRRSSGALADGEPRTALLGDEATIFLAAFDGTEPIGFVFGYELPRRHGNPSILFVVRARRRRVVPAGRASRLG